MQTCVFLFTPIGTFIFVFKFIFRLKYQSMFHVFSASCSMHHSHLEFTVPCSVFFVHFRLRVHVRIHVHEDVGFGFIMMLRFVPVLMYVDVDVYAKSTQM